MERSTPSQPCHGSTEVRRNGSTCRRWRPHGFTALGLLLVGCASAGTSSPAQSPETVDIPSGSIHLKAFLWRPPGRGPFPAVLFNHGSGGATAGETAGMPITEAARRLAPLFVEHGYAFLYPFRRGQGLSADQAPFLQDVLARERADHGDAAAQRLHFVLLTTEQLEDVEASLAWLKQQPGIDPRRIAIAGHSFGGVLTLLAAGDDPSLRAAVAFAAAANSWSRSPELRERLLGAVGATSAAVMLVQAENDYDTEPTRALSSEMERLGKPHLARIYPPVGKTPDDGHSALYEAIPMWKGDVFTFLEAALRPLGRDP
jgi:carboxymethylenebutenolidase